MGEFDDGFEDEGLDPSPPWQRKQTVDELVKASSAEDPEQALESVLFDVVSAYLGDHLFAARFTECMEILRRKNADYSQNEQKRDRVAAFKRIARDVGISTRQAWAVFAQKHWGAIMRYVKDGFVESEPLDGRINDMINYLVLLGAIVEWETSLLSEDEDA